MLQKTLKTLLVCWCIAFTLLVSASAAEVITEKYKFPIVPGMPEWSEFESVTEMREACQVPEEILENMTTEALVQTAMDHPFLTDLYFYDTLQDGFDSLAESSNVVAELLQRDDAAEALFNEYNTIQISDENTDFLDFAAPRFLETALCQPEIVRHLNKQQVETLSNAFFENYTFRAEHPAIFSRTSAAYQIQAEKTVSSSADTTFIKTPNGTDVEVWITNQEFTSAEKREEDETAQKQYPNAEFVSSASMAYNCHSYAWLQNSRYNYTKYWMDDPSAFWTDRSFLTRSGSIKVGDIGVYTNVRGTVKHSAIVDSISNSKPVYISKWGDGPVMIHTEFHCPYGANFSITKHYYEA